MLLVAEHETSLFHGIHLQDLLDDHRQSIDSLSEVRRFRNQIDLRIGLIAAVIVQSRTPPHLMISLSQKCVDEIYMVSIIRLLLIWLLSDYNIEVDRFGLNKKDTGSPYTVRHRGIR